MSIPVLILCAYISILPFYLQWDYISDKWTLGFKIAGIGLLMICMANIYWNMRKK